MPSPPTSLPAPGARSATPCPAPTRRATAPASRSASLSIPLSARRSAAPFAAWFAARGVALTLLLSGALLAGAPGIAQADATHQAAPETAHAAMREEVRIVVQNSPLAGFRYHEAAALWPRLREGDRLTLVREADNPHDANAVRIDWHGHVLGYLPRTENAAVAAALDAGEAVAARLARLREHRNPRLRLLIEVFVRL